MRSFALWGPIKFGTRKGEESRVKPSERFLLASAAFEFRCIDLRVPANQTASRQRLLLSVFYFARLGAPVRLVADRAFFAQVYASSGR